MAIQTNGFGDSSFDDVSWAQTSALTSGPFRVADAAAWRPTIVPGIDRTISIAAGLAVACGVRASNTTAARLTFTPNPGSQVRRDAVVARFDWAADTVTFLALPGGSQPPAVVTTAVDPNQMNRIHRIPGVLYDALIAVVSVSPNLAALAANDLTDLRVWGWPILNAAGSSTYQALIDLPLGGVLRLPAGAGLPVRDLTRSGDSWRQLAPATIGSYAGIWYDLPQESLTSVREVWGTNPQVLGEISIPDPGVPYELELELQAEIGSTQPSTRWDPHLALDTVNGPSLGQQNGGRWVNDGSLEHLHVRPLRTNRALTGPHKVLVVARAGYYPTAGPAFGVITPYNRRLEARVYAA